ncbi:MAG: hypothetical protein R6X16_06505 [Anaerolineae bacterium]
MALLARAGREEATQPIAWASGDWTRAGAEASPERSAMALFMARRMGAPAAGASLDPDAPLSPVAAFSAPLPPLDRPSLGAARRLLETGPQVGSFLGDRLAEE